MALLCSERLYREHADRKAKHVLGYGWLWMAMGCVLPVRHGQIAIGQKLSD
jgi:hypothetical protein